MPTTGHKREGTFLFDLDGTLVDSRAGIVNCFRHAFEELDKPSPSEEMLVASIGQPFRRAFAGFLDTSDEHLIEQAVRLYRNRYAETGLYEATMYEGVPEMLLALDGQTAYVATSKATVYASRIIGHFGLARHFRGVYGPDLHGQPGDKTELLEHLFRAAHISGKTVMIGDRADDMRAAINNGCLAVGVLWGYGSAPELATAGAQILCATPAELAEEIDKTFRD
jgi:phosphoglycolate phosphatase